MSIAEGERLPGLAEMLEPVLLRAVEDKAALEELYSAFNPAVDVRMTTFAKIINTIIPKQGQTVYAFRRALFRQPIPDRLPFLDHFSVAAQFQTHSCHALFEANAARTYCR
jgi:hypothetical protein